MSKAFRAAFQPGCSQPSLRGRLIEFQDHLSVLVFNLHTDPRVEFGCLVRGRDVGDVDDIDTALPARSRAAAASSALSAAGEQSYPVTRCRLGAGGASAATPRLAVSDIWHDSQPGCRQDERESRGLGDSRRPRAVTPAVRQLV
jgi:hypothetical protein